MIDQFEDSLIFSVHILLLAAKILMVWLIAKSFIVTRSFDKNSFMVVAKSWQVLLFIFTCFVLISEVWILSNYYMVYSNFYYEILAMIDQLFLTIMFVLSYKGGK